jgi:hypothetical protein
MTKRTDAGSPRASGVLPIWLSGLMLTGDAVLGAIVVELVARRLLPREIRAQCGRRRDVRHCRHYLCCSYRVRRHAGLGSCLGMLRGFRPHCSGVRFPCECRLPGWEQPASFVSVGVNSSQNAGRSSVRYDRLHTREQPFRFRPNRSIEVRRGSVRSGSGPAKPLWVPSSGRLPSWQHQPRSPAAAHPLPTIT